LTVPDIQTHSGSCPIYPNWRIYIQFVFEISSYYFVVMDCFDYSKNIQGYQTLESCLTPLYSSKLSIQYKCKGCKLQSTTDIAAKLTIRLDMFLRMCLYCDPAAVITQWIVSWKPFYLLKLVFVRLVLVIPRILLRLISTLPPQQFLTGMLACLLPKYAIVLRAKPPSQTKDMVIKYQVDPGIAKWGYN